MMKHLFTYIVFTFGLSLFSAQQTEIPILNYEETEKKIDQYQEKFLVVNLWSTTCAPCVKELPDFMEVNEKFKNNPNYKMLLISLDRPKDLERVKKFIKDKNIQAEVLILDDIKRMNTWIPRYDKNWMGEIPVTIFYHKGEKVLFHNGEMSKTDLENTITKYVY